MAKRGRPKIEINWEEFEKLCAIQCTLIEISTWFHCDTKTIETKVKRKYGKIFSEVFKEKRTVGFMSLRRAQWTAALAGDKTLQIFLGKNYLGQKDRWDLGGAGGNEPIRLLVEYEGDNGNGHQDSPPETPYKTNAISPGTGKAEDN